LNVDRRPSSSLRRIMASEVPDLAAGLQLTRHVRLVRQLGEGAMGEVWVGFHETLRCEVAVKFLAAHLVENREAMERFEREASISAQLQSPYVVQTFDQGVTDDGRPFLIMELLDGDNLSTLLRRRGRLPVRDVARVLRHVAKALSRAHKIGVVHCDVKPDNLFISPTSDGLFTRVLDFGIARRADLSDAKKSKRRGALFGTPEYMSREQVMTNDPVDFRADLWAVAVTTYQALTGKLPFEGDSLVEVCAAIADGQFAPPSRVAPVPRALDVWFERALNRDPVERYASAKEMASAFGKLLPEDDEVLDELTASGVHRVSDPLAAAPPSSSLRRWPFALTAVAVAALTTVIGIYLLGEQDTVAGALPGAVAGAPATPESPRPTSAPSDESDASDASDESDERDGPEEAEPTDVTPEPLEPPGLATADVPPPQPVEPSEPSVDDSPGGSEAAPIAPAPPRVRTTEKKEDYGF
ncbi:MAG: protein kinase, partial [Polyangiaceae bacterium]